ncbi:hypothetical protein AM586_01840 [Massilia sp. WG5]|nr:hypothetical protein AM586_01840 [Massilia sp. WG5]
MSVGAYAAPAIALPDGPLYLKFTGQEQIATNGATTWNANGVKEINWGVFSVETLYKGNVVVPHDSVNPITPAIYANGFSGGQITGMFYGVQAGTASTDPLNAFPATGGYLDLYWRDTSKMSASSTDISPAGVRCGYSCATGFTEGTFLARIMFDTGMDTGNTTNTIVGTTIPSSNGFSGVADSYGSVVADATVNGMTGLWANQLDSNWFSSYLGLRDLRFKNSYNYNPTWNGGANILGARIDDPAQAYSGTVPEPGVLSLMGLAMVGMGAALRRREKKPAK